MNICVYGASSDDIAPEYIAETEALGAELARRGHGLVFGGGGHGLMGAVARGAVSAGGTVCGVAPRFFESDGILFARCTTLIRTETMRERKEKMEQLSDAFIMAPGGIGTFEEFFEVLTLRQLGRHNKPIAVFNVRGYFDPLLAAMRHAADEGFLGEQCFDLFTVTDDGAALLDALARPQSPAEPQKPV